MSAAAAATTVKKVHESQSLRESIVRSVDWTRDWDSSFNKIQAIEVQDRAKKDDGTPFERQLTLAMSCVVLINFLTMAIELEVKYSEESSNAIDFWYFTEFVFMMLFAIEICARIVLEGNLWYQKAWNWFDVCCLVPSVLSACSPFLGASQVSLLNLLRLLKLARLIRIIKVVQKCEALYVVVMAWWKAMAGIIYVIMMIFFGLFIFSILATEMIGRNRSMKDVMLGERSAEELYGSVARSIFTLFQMMTLEGFEEKTRPLVEIQPLLTAYFFVFVMFFTFGLLNMLVGQVVEKTLAETRRMQAEQSSDNQATKLRTMVGTVEEVFDMLDIDGTGAVSRFEFQSRMQHDDRARQHLQDSGVPMCNIRDFYNIVDLDGNGEVLKNEFISGCLRLQSCPVEEFHNLATHACVRALDYRMSRFDERQKQQHELIAKHAAKVLTNAMSPSAHDAVDMGDFGELSSPLETRPPAVANPLLEEVMANHDRIISMLQNMAAVNERIASRLDNLEAAFQAATLWNGTSSSGDVEPECKPMKNTTSNSPDVDYEACMTQEFPWSQLEEMLSYKLKTLEVSVKDHFDTITNIDATCMYHNRNARSGNNIALSSARLGSESNFALSSGRLGSESNMALPSDRPESEGRVEVLQSRQVSSLSQHRSIGKQPSSALFTEHPGMLHSQARIEFPLGHQVGS